jgi:hypothetical protein
MRVKKVVLRDASTRIALLVLQFDEADETFCNPIGFGAGMKIILKFSGSTVLCITDYKLIEALHDRNRINDPIDPEWDRTMASFGQLLNQVDNVLHLPDEISVEQIRGSINELMHRPLLNSSITETLENYFDHSHLKKIIYRTDFQRTATAIIDTNTNEIAMHYSTNVNQQCEIAQYLWIPLEAATEIEIEPLKKKLEFKSFILNQ